MTGALLSIDPGPTESAWCVLDPDGSIAAHAKEDNAALRKRLLGMAGEAPYSRPDGVVTRIFAGPRGWHPIESVAIETIASYGMAVGAEVFETCIWVGRYVELCADLPTRLVYRKEVKMHLCQSMKAKDANIRAAIIDKLGPRGTKRQPGPTFGISGDVWSALAVAIVARETPWTGAA